MDSDAPELEQALREAADEAGLPRAYWRCVRPFLRDPEGAWPRCCGEGCPVCVQTLEDVALRVLERLGTPRRAPVE